MKKKINYLFVILFTEIVFGQQRVGINTDTPNESAVLHCIFLLPQTRGRKPSWKQ